MKLSLIGLMSGTSTDGLDIAYCDFEEENGKVKGKLVHWESIVFEEDMKWQLLNAHKLDGLSLTKLDRVFGTWCGIQVQKFLDLFPESNPMAIASHGHTIFHQPNEGLTLQIGHGPSLAAAAGLPVINDFRSLDVAMGGQGAPLVPIGDRDLFSEWDACLNLGGIANISFFKDTHWKAFDICAVNLLLNPLATRMGLGYDNEGSNAKKGKCLPELLEVLNSNEWFSLQGPKSLGREWIAQHQIPLLEKGNTLDLLNTCVEHIAIQISQIIMHHLPNGASILVSGGGAYNLFLIERIQAQCPKHKIVRASNEIIEFKEAFIFAYLGYLRILGKPNGMAEVTGASKDSLGGAIHGVIKLPFV
jgi:anhydro-N-acetylmuramic acid kinase